MTLDAAFRDQAETCERMGSPFTGKVLTLIADNWNPKTRLAKSFAQYKGDLGPAGHSLPLRLMGGLHALVLSGRDADLARVYPPDPSADFSKHVLRALQEHEEFLLDWTKNTPQTNEVRRSAALIPMAYVALQHFNRPIHLSELGASGGLNLHWDHFALQAGDTRLGPSDAALTLTPDWSGPMPPAQQPQIIGRGGVDLNPLDPRSEDGLLRLSSYLWPDQPDRLERTRAAANIATARVDQSDAIEWLETRLATAPKGQMHMIQNTVAWQYFPANAQERGEAMIKSAGASATQETPLAWAQMETDGDTTGKVGAALSLRLWPGNLTLHLGRADFHGRWIKWEQTGETQNV